MAFLSIPVWFYPDDYDPERDEDLKLKVEMREGTMTINIFTLCQYHETEQGTVIFSLADGTIMESPLSYEQFRGLIDKIAATVDVITTGKN